MAKNGIDWSPERIARLSQLLGEGKSRGQIAAMWNVGKGAIVAKVRRLQIPGGPPPSMRLSPEQERRAVELWNDGATCAQIERETGLKSATAFASRRSDCRPRRPGPQPAPKPDARKTPPPSPLQLGRVTECCWPIGEPGSRGFRMCDEPTEPGRSYCAPHCNVAYVRVSHATDQMDLSA